MTQECITLEEDLGKVYSLKHLLPETFIGIVLLPIGSYYNRHLLKARRNDFIKFQNDPKHKYRILSVAELALNTQIAALLSRFVYQCSMVSLLAHWRIAATVEGNTKSAVSSSKCLVIQYEDVQYSLNEMKQLPFKYKEKGIIPDDIVKGIKTPGERYQLITGEIVTIEYLRTCDNRRGDYTKDLDKSCKELYRMNFECFRAHWIARIGSVSDFWHWIKLTIQ